MHTALLPDSISALKPILASKAITLLKSRKTLPDAIPEESNQH